MSSIVRPITELRPESRQIPALEKLSIEELLRFLQGIKDPDFHKERKRLEQPAEVILRRLQHAEGRADFKETKEFNWRMLIISLLVGIATIAGAYYAWLAVWPK